MTENDPLVCRRAETREDIEACLAIRDTVFVREQAVDPALERDGLDAACAHYLVLIESEPVATARVRAVGDKLKIQRVAVLKQARGKGIGDRLMRFLMDDCATRPDMAGPGRHFFLSSQTHAIPFYERLGFEVCSEEYPEAGIAHRDMRAGLR